MKTKSIQKMSVFLSLIISTTVIINGKVSFAVISLILAGLAYLLAKKTQAPVYYSLRDGRSYLESLAHFSKVIRSVAWLGAILAIGYSALPILNYMLITLVLHRHLDMPDLTPISGRLVSYVLTMVAMTVLSLYFDKNEATSDYAADMENKLFQSEGPEGLKLHRLSQLMRSDVILLTKASKKAKLASSRYSDLFDEEIMELENSMVDLPYFEREVGPHKLIIEKLNSIRSLLDWAVADMSPYNEEITKIFSAISDSNYPFYLSVRRLWRLDQGVETFFEDRDNFDKTLKLLTVFESDLLTMKEEIKDIYDTAQAKLALQRLKEEEERLLKIKAETESKIKNTMDLF